MAELWRGAPVAEAIRAELRPRVERLAEQGIRPTLAIVRVGAREDDLSYERGAMKACEKVGLDVRQFLLPADCPREALLSAVRQVNEDGGIHGCLLLRPLPDREDEALACALLSPEKDVDCVTPGSLGAVFSGAGAGFPPCTAQACLEILEHYGCVLRGKRVTVVGRSLVIGKPVAMLLLARDATVTVCHTKTADLAARCREAEVLVVAAGKAGVVDGGFTAPGQVVVDVGIHVDESGKLRGDVDFDSVEPVAGAVTPVPGGVGTVTSAVLVKHVVEAAERVAP